MNTHQPLTSFVARNTATGALLQQDGETVICRTFDGAVTMIICLISPTNRPAWTPEAVQS